jgi:hypothetical protein
MPLYESLQNVLNVLVQIANKMGLRKRKIAHVTTVFVSMFVYMLKISKTHVFESLNVHFVDQVQSIFILCWGGD